MPHHRPEHLIHGFFGEYRWLSNFYPCLVVLDRLIFSSSEAAYQAQKTDDREEQRKFTTMSPHEAKKAGKALALSPRPDNWDSRRLEVMRRCIDDKFSSANPALVDRLIATGDALLEEGNWWKDGFWGITYPSRQDCLDGTNRQGGANWLGKLLMERRLKLQDLYPVVRG